MVDRYDISYNGDEGTIEEDEDGDYVKYQEYKKLKERIKFAMEYLPESPNKAMGFLKPILKGE